MRRRRLLTRGARAAAGITIISVLLAGCASDGAKSILLLSKTATGPGEFTPPLAPAESLGLGDFAGDRALADDRDTLSITVRLGDEQQLHGGARNESGCDRQTLIEALEEDAEVRSVWAAALDLSDSSITDYIELTTPVVLRNDTRVSAHSYADGGAEARQVVLQSGTAVLVDPRGLPVVRCLDGAPLTAASPVSGSVRFDGDPWRGFDPASLISIRAASETVDTFILVDRTDGSLFVRPTGTDGADDFEPS